MTIAADGLKPLNDAHKALRKQLVVDIQKQLSVVDAAKDTIANGIKPAM